MATPVKSKFPNTIIRVIDHDAPKKRKWVESITKDTYPGKAWPPCGGTKMTSRRRLALRFYSEKFAQKIAKKLSFVCGCGKVHIDFMVEKI